MKKVMYKVCDSLVERKQKQARSDRRFIFSIAFAALIIVVIAFINSLLFFSVLVDGSSMSPTLKSGDILVANKHKDFDRGDIVVIKDNATDINGKEKLLIKRVIATGLDTVEIIDGVVKVNGKVLKEDYIPKGYTDADDDVEYFTVPKGEVFYLGDNRWNSSDSRSKGTCKESQIIGVIEDWSLSARGIGKFINNIGKFFRG